VALSGNWLTGALIYHGGPVESTSYPRPAGAPVNFNDFSRSADLQREVKRFTTSFRLRTMPFREYFLNPWLLASILVISHRHFQEKRIPHSHQSGLHEWRGSPRLISVTFAGRHRAAAWIDHRAADAPAGCSARARKRRREAKCHRQNSCGMRCCGNTSNAVARIVRQPS